MKWVYAFILIFTLSAPVVMLDRIFPYEFSTVRHDDAEALYREKLQKLNDLPPPRLILVGGRDVYSGFDQLYLAQKFRRNVVNLGVPEGLSPAIQLLNLKPYLEERDVVLLSFDYEAYQHTEGLERRAFFDLTAQEHVEGVWRSLRPLLSMFEDWTEIAVIKDKGVSWDVARAQSLQNILWAFKLFAQDRKARVLATYPSIPFDDIYTSAGRRAQRGALDALYYESDIPVIGTPYIVMYDPEFYDGDVLNAEGKQKRTKELSVLLDPYL